MAVEQITKDGKILAIIIRKGITDPLKFATPDDFPFQVGVHNKEAGDKIQAHVHIPFPELKNLRVQEFFYIISGKLKVNLYDSDEKKVQDVVLNEGDSIVLDCGHGFEFLEKTSMIELKQGPYRGKEQEKKMIEE